MDARRAIRDTLEGRLMPFWRQRRVQRNELILLGKANGGTTKELAKLARCNIRTVKRVVAAERARVAALKAATVTDPLQLQPEAPKTPAEVEAAAESDLLIRAEEVYKKAHRQELPEPPAYEPPRAPAFQLNDGVMLRYDPSQLDSMRLHPADRALMTLGDDRPSSQEPTHEQYSEERKQWSRNRGGF